MKDVKKIWVVHQEGSPLHSAIRCDGGKAQAKEVRRSKTQETKKTWVAKKIDEEQLQVI